MTHSTSYKRWTVLVVGVLAGTAAACADVGGAGPVPPRVTTAGAAARADLPPMVLQTEASTPAPAERPAALPALPPPPEPLPPPPPEEHHFTVRSGETIGLYAHWSGLSEAEVKEQNGLRRARRLRVGKPFSIVMTPEQAVRFSRMRREFHRRREEGWFRTHEVVRLLPYVVRAGDSLHAISKRYSDVPRWLMEKVNVGHDLRHLRPGDIVNLPVVREAPPASQREAERRAAAVPDGASPWSDSGWEPPRPQTPLRVERPPLPGGPTQRVRPRAWSGFGEPAEGEQNEGERAHRRPSPATQRAAAPQNTTWFSDARDDGPLPPAVVDVRVKVRKGECVSLYAQWAGTTTDRVAAANALADAGHLRVGQELRIPVSEPDVARFYEQRRTFHNGAGAAATAAPPSDAPSGGSFIYTVKPGETAWEIAVQRYGITLRDLERLNPTASLDRLRAGDTLRIPVGVRR